MDDEDLALCEKYGWKNADGYGPSSESLVDGLTEHEEYLEMNPYPFVFNKPQLSSLEKRYERLLNDCKTCDECRSALDLTEDQLTAVASSYSSKYCAR